MEFKKRTTAVLLLFLFSLPPAALHAQSPNEALWKNFVTQVPGLPKIPKDTLLGELADSLDSASEWAGILTVCDRVFKGIYQGAIPEELLFPAVKTPLELFFNEALKDGGKTASPRYGIPTLQGNRADVPVRLVGTDPPVAGNIYLVRDTGSWQIEQWSLNLSTLPLSGLKKENQGAPEKIPEAQESEPSEP